MQDAAWGCSTRLGTFFTGATPAEEINRAFWGACHGGQQPSPTPARPRRRPQLDPGWENLTPLDAATRTGATELVAWLRSQGAATAAELGRSVHCRRWAAQWRA